MSLVCIKTSVDLYGDIIGVLDFEFYTTMSM